MFQSLEEDPAITPAWLDLVKHSDRLSTTTIGDLVAADPDRSGWLGHEAAGIAFDASRQRVDSAVLASLLDLAQQRGVLVGRDRMLSGEHINVTEDRAVLHTALRAPRHAHVTVDGVNVIDEVHAVLDRMAAFARRIRSGEWKGATGRPISTVVNIGIGGSDLGPQMAVLALQDVALPGKRFHFVSNVDGHEMASVLKDLKAENTLFLIASKTFTTIETMTNARSALAWFQGQGGQHVARHFAALTTNVSAAAEMGITTTFGFWDWVGGRYSMWSAIGLPVAIAIGAQGFKDLLAGAHDMDQHFQTAPLQSNLPVRLGLLDVWYRNFLHYTSRSIAPYHSALRRVPAYLQQLEMESNGKRVDRTGQALPYDTSPVLWGEPGTNGQHAYFQMLHQGTDIVPMEFIAVKKPTHHLKDHHELLLANVIAQAQALMLGKSDAGGHKHFTGNRPSTFLMLDELTPTSLGALIALQEHRVFVSGAVWGINSFDQWGVELGKVLAKDIHARIVSGDASGLDASTAALLSRIR